MWKWLKQKWLLWRIKRLLRHYPPDYQKLTMERALDPQRARRLIERIDAAIREARNAEPRPPASGC